MKAFLPMGTGISISDLSYASDTIAETHKGISGPKVVTYCNHFASEHNVRIPHASYPFDMRVGNKRTALLENLRAFPAHLQYALILEMCADRSLADLEQVQAVRQRITDRYSHLSGTSAPVVSVPTPAQIAERSAVPTPAPPWAQSERAKPQRPYDIFLSYCHADEELMNFVRKHHVVFDRQKLIRKWWDRKLVAGKELDRSITNYLSHSDIILLFVSSDFIASDYCYDVEMTQALKQREAGRSVVIPVILRPCNWRSTPLGTLLALPRDGLPLTKWGNADDAAKDIADGVMRAVAELQAKD